MKKVRFPIVWILLLAAICALTAALAKNIKWVRQEFPMDGSNVSQLDSAQIAGKIAKTQKLKNSEALYVNADNFELRLTKNFDFENRGTIRFFYYDKWDVYSAQLRIHPDSGKFFVTERGEWAEQQSVYQLTDYLDALKFLPQAEIGARYPDAQGYLVMLTEGGTPEDFEDVLTYGKDGAGEIDGWQIHLLLIPRYEKAETDAEDTEDAAAGTQWLHLFYENAAAKKRENKRRYVRQHFCRTVFLQIWRLPCGACADMIEERKRVCRARRTEGGAYEADPLCGHPPGFSDADAYDGAAGIGAKYGNAAELCPADGVCAGARGARGSDCGRPV